MTASTSGTVCLVTGSLRGERSSSHRFLQRLERLLLDKGMTTNAVTVRGGASATYADAEFAAMEACDAVVIAAPLYSYCLPSGLMRLFECWSRYAAGHPRGRCIRVYAIINCGFVVPETMTEAISVVRHFSRRLGFEWRFAVAIASGPVAVLTSSLDRRLRNAFDAVASDIVSGSRDALPDRFIKPIVPRVFLDTVREYLDWRVQRDIQKKAV